MSDQDLDLQSTPSAGASAMPSLAELEGSFKPRSAFAVLIMGYLTLLIYPLWWTQATAEEAAKLRGVAAPSRIPTAICILMLALLLADFAQDLRRQWPEGPNPLLAVILALVLSLLLGRASAHVGRALGPAQKITISVPVQCALGILFAGLWIPVGMAFLQRDINRAKAARHPMAWTPTWNQTSEPAE